MKMNNFNYFKASDIQLMEHLIAEIKDIMNDPECSSHTNFRYYEKKSLDYGTCRCAIGWIGYRSRIPVESEDFSKIFLYTFSLYNHIFEKLEDKNDIYKRKIWDSIFGPNVTLNYNDRLNSAKKIYELLLDYEVNERGKKRYVKSGTS